MFSQGMDFCFRFEGPSGEIRFKCTVKGMTGLDSQGGKGGKAIGVGVLNDATAIVFETTESTGISLSGKNIKGGTQQQSLFDAGWKFDDMGIGGLSTQFRCVPHYLAWFAYIWLTRLYSVYICSLLGYSYVPALRTDGPNLCALGRSGRREMFRRAFVSRIFPTDVIEKLGISHTKGVAQIEFLDCTRSNCSSRHILRDDFDA